MLALIFFLPSLGGAGRLEESAERSDSYGQQCSLAEPTLYQQLCWPAQGKLHVLWSGTANPSHWERWEQALPDLTPATPVASSVSQSHRGVAWPAEGKIHVYSAANSDDFKQWMLHDIEQLDVISSTNLASGGSSKYQLIAWPDQGKMHMFWWGEANGWNDWERIEYNERIVMVGLENVSAVTTIITDTHHVVAWPDQGKIQFFYEDYFEWNKWMKVDHIHPEVNPRTILGSDGTTDYHLVSWPTEGKLHMFWRNSTTIGRWRKWECDILPDLYPTTPVTVSVTEQARAVYWPGDGKIHEFSENVEKWGDWKHYEMAQPDVTRSTRLSSGGLVAQPAPAAPVTPPTDQDPNAGALQRASARHSALLMTIVAWVSSL
eukprot:TRINITY_DN65317_c0_g1_i1.p1 TRINITY_DN65317_c0_g1~~TRINITY_DN65317_c0_g1_i1.p1  ORF type:complete len:376 (+),score=35.65 TRINITY_DN65317_c0_g1_i1:74-1201(+)